MVSSAQGQAHEPGVTSSSLAACSIHSYLVSKGESRMGTKHVLSKITESFVSQRVEDERRKQQPPRSS